MAFGRISGPLLKSNLVRDGIDLAFENDLVYLRVTDSDPNNHKVGIKNDNPLYTLDVGGTIHATNLVVDSSVAFGGISLDTGSVSATGGNLTLSGHTASDKVIVSHDLQVTGSASAAALYDSGNRVATIAGGLVQFGVTISTTDVVEGTNLYFTTARARSSISASGAINYNSTTGVISFTQGNTDTVSEGTTNLYFTNTRARAAISAGTGISYNSTTGAISSTITQYTDALARAAISVSGDLSYNSSTGVISYTHGNTDTVSEGTTNKYYTDARARAAISAGTGISYNSTTGVVSSSITQYTDALARAAISVSGDLSYNSTTGVISYTHGNTDTVSEGTTNLYFTNTRARAAISAGTGISYNSTTGVVSSSITQYTDALARAAISAGTGISYNSTTGVVSSSITQYTDALARAAISVSGDLSYNASTGVISYTHGNTDTVSEGTSNLYFTTTRARSSISTAVTTTAGLASSASISYNSTTGVITFNSNTDNISEGTTNKYYTDARARAALSASGSIGYNSTTGAFTYTQGNTDTVSEGTTNKYYTDARARAAISVSGDLSYDSATGVISYTHGNTDTVSEGSSNLYFTTARARSAISAGAGISYNSATGVVSSSITQYTDAMAVSANTSAIATAKSEAISAAATDATTKANTAEANAKSYADTKVAAVVNSSPAALDTLYELAAALGNDANFSTTIATTIGTKLAITDFASTFDTRLATKTTDNLSEGATNLYFTNTRARSAISAGAGISYNSATGVVSSSITQYTDAMAKAAISVSGDLSYDSATGVISYTHGNTDTVSEGTTNLYFTNTRARAALSASGAINYNSTTGAFTFTQGNTDTVSEGTTNKYYTDARARASVSSGSSSLVYNSTTGVFTLNLGGAGGTLGTIAGQDSDNVSITGGTISGLTSLSATSITGALTGNASTATKLASAKNINGVAFDGSTDITITAAASTLTGTALNDNIVGSKLTSVGTLTNLTVTNTIIGSVSGNAGTVTNGVYTTGAYSNPDWLSSLAYSKLTGAPTLATVATSGSYTDLTDKPTIPTQYTDAMARGAISVISTPSNVLTYNSTTGQFVFDTPTTSEISEGTNLYFTNERAIAALPDQTSNGGKYLFTDGSGVLSWQDVPPPFSGNYMDLANKPVIPSLGGFSFSDNVLTVTDASTLYPIFQSPSDFEGSAAFWGGMGGQDLRIIIQTASGVSTPAMAALSSCGPGSHITISDGTHSMTVTINSNGWLQNGDHVSGIDYYWSCQTVETNTHWNSWFSGLTKFAIGIGSLAGHHWTFGDTLKFPDDSIQSTAWTGTFSYNDLTDKPVFSADRLTSGQYSVTLEDTNGNLHIPGPITAGTLNETYNLVQDYGQGGDYPRGDIKTHPTNDYAIVATVTPGWSPLARTAFASLTTSASGLHLGIEGLYTVAPTGIVNVTYNAGVYTVTFDQSINGGFFDWWISGFTFITNTRSGSWKFDDRLTFPDATEQTTAWLGTYSYNDLTDKPTISYNDLSNKPTLYSSAYIGTTNLDFTRASGIQTLSGINIDGNAETVTHGVYTTDTGTVTNSMLAGSIANNKLVNPYITINSTNVALGGSITVAPPAMEDLTLSAAFLFNNTGGVYNGSVTKRLDVNPGVIATLQDAQTLTSKTFKYFTFADGVNPNKKLSFDLSSLYAGSTAVVAFPYYSGAAIVYDPINGAFNMPNGVITNGMLAGSIANDKLANSTITINGTAVALGGSITVSGGGGGTVSNEPLNVGVGLQLDTGTAYDGTASRTIGLQSSVVIVNNVQTLTNKTISGATNTLTNIPNSALSNNWIMINNIPVPLGGSINVGGSISTITAGTGLQFDGAGPYDGMTNRTISVANIPNSALVNSAISINGTQVSLGGSISGLVTTMQLANSYITINGSNVAIGGGISGLAATANNLTQFAMTTSSQLASIISGKTGTGSLVFAAVSGTPASGQALVWDGTTWTPGNVSASIGSYSIDALADVDTTTASPTSGQALVWDGTNWVPGTVSSGGSGGVVLPSQLLDAIVPDDVTSVFALTHNGSPVTPANSESVIVIIDGAYQLPYSAYEIIGSNISFAEALSAGSVVSMVNVGGAIPAITGLTDVNVTSPTNGQTLVWDAASSKWVNGAGGSGFYEGTASIATPSTVAADTFDAAAYTTAKYLIQATAGSDIHTTELTVIHNGTTAYSSEYGGISTTDLFTIDVELVSGNVNVNVTTTVADTTVDFKRISIISRLSSGFLSSGDLGTLSGTEDLSSGTGSEDLAA